MVQNIYRCCSNKPDFQITYSVSGSKKDYLVCLSCLQKKYFAKYIIRKIPITNTYRKKFQNENHNENIHESLEANVNNEEIIPENLLANLTNTITP